MRLPRPTLTVAVLFWAGLFLAAQAVSVAHLHTDEGADAACVVCTLVKSDAIASHTPAVAAPPALRFRITPAPAALLPRQSDHRPFQARAPPLG